MRKETEKLKRLIKNEQEKQIGMFMAKCSCIRTCVNINHILWNYMTKRNHMWCWMSLNGVKWRFSTRSLSKVVAVSIKSKITKIVVVAYVTGFSKKFFNWPNFSKLFIWILLVRNRSANKNKFWVEGPLMEFPKSFFPSLQYC